MSVSQPPIWNPIVSHTLMTDDRDRATLAVWRTPRVWVQWFTELFTALAQSASIAANGAASATGTAQAASIASTALGAATYPEGTYRVSVTAQVTQAATTSSSVTMTVSWTSYGASCSYSWPAMTGNTTATTLTAPPLMIHVDQATSVSYSTTYASVGATPMQYAYRVVMETLP